MKKIQATPKQQDRGTPLRGSFQNFQQTPRQIFKVDKEELDSKMRPEI